MKTISAEQFKKKYGETDLSKFEPIKTTPQDNGFVQNEINSVKNRLDEAGNALNDTQGNPVVRGLKTTGAISNIVTDTAGNIIKEIPIVNKIAEGAGNLIKKGFDFTTGKIADTKLFKEASQYPEHTKVLEDFLSAGGSLGDIANNILMLEGARAGTRATYDGAKEVLDSARTKVKDVFTNAETGVNNAKNAFGDRVSRILAPEADEATKTILRESKPTDVQKYVNLQEASIKDPRAITPYEFVGDRMANATKQLESQRKALGAQKATIINKARYGLDDFTKPTNETILKLMKINDPTAQGFIAKLKNVNNKLQADKVIDDMQDVLYKGNKDMTIPAGSAVDKQLKGIIGEYNGKLKASLPTSYQTLNTKISNITKVTGALNKALGEVVDGVSTRGGSLVKQFFSPNGRKAKELFDYVKTNTGVDLAKEATLARYIMQLYGDSRANTLLGGNIPTSVNGIINKVIDFGVEKAGVGKKLQDMQRAGAIEKAKDLTTP